MLLGGPHGPLDGAAGCVCVFLGDAHGKVEAAFVGRAIAVESWYGGVRTGRDSLPHFMKTVTLVVERGWSGAPPDTVRALIEDIGPDCPTRFTPGQHYLPFTTLYDGEYVVTGCGMTSQVRASPGSQISKC